MEKGGIMKRILLELNGAWVLEHRTDAKLPVAMFIEYCIEIFGSDISVAKDSLTECELILNHTELACEEIEVQVSEILRLKMNIPDGTGIASVSVRDFEDQETKTEPEETSVSDIGRMSAEEMLRTSRKDTSTVETSGKTVDERISSLIGAEEFKALVDEIKLIAPRVVEHRTYEAFAFQSYIFSINDGCGLSTYLKLFTEVLEDQKLFKFNDRQRIFEEKLLPPGGDKYNPFAPVISHMEGLGYAGGKMICIDISEWMTRLGDKQFRKFLMDLEDHTTENIIIFRVPFVEEEVLDTISGSLGDILFVRPVSFPPMTSEELTGCGKRFLTKFGFSADDDVWNIFEARITEEKSDGRFYGMNTVKKVIREMVYRKQLSDVHNNVNDTQIKKSDVLSLAKSMSKEYIDGLASLEGLVGMEQIRQSVEEIITQIELARQNKSLGSPSLHMRFVGNPGTGKTTVARLVGQILKERGVLRNGNFFEYSGRDFCGRYIGETAPKTAGMCRDAYGSVLFIDEAYSLYRGDDDGRDYGREALDTLIAEMENHRSDLVVIMAGYPDDMAELMHGNAGLESRMPYIIEFPNYTREQLYRIFMKMTDGGGIVCAEDFENAVREYFNSLSDELLRSKSFSNARFVRNLFERTCAKAGIRKKIEKAEQLVLTKEDFRQASSERAFGQLQEKKVKNRIGF